MMSNEGPLPPRYAELKREIAASIPDFESKVTKAWKEVTEELKNATGTIAREGSDYIPQVKFQELGNLGADEIQKIKERGAVVIKDIVDDEVAMGWRRSLEEFVRVNPAVEGVPADDKQFFQLYWTKAQVQARAHPNVLAATVWLNKLYKSGTGRTLDGVDLSTPLTYADRFRIRHPGVQWNAHPPHIDGGSTERWEDPVFRQCFADILSGEWKRHDPYELEGRLNARSSLYGRPNQATVFRTFQGWLAVSEIAPNQGTLKVFPNVHLSNAYIILRPFFRPLVPIDDPGILDANNWEFDISSSNFPGIYARDGGFTGPRPTPELHPHLCLEQSMTSVPKVNPGDAVFWHCDVVHSVEVEHTGSDESAVMYIPAVPLTPQNKAYIEKQKNAFLNANRPPDFPQGMSEAGFVGIATAEDIKNPLGRQAMGLASA